MHSNSHVHSRRNAVVRRERLARRTTRFVSVSTARTRAGRVSRHAAARCQQRGVAADVVPLILEYGDAAHVGRGCMRFLMTSAALGRLPIDAATPAVREKLAGCYVVIGDDGTVITVGHHYRR